MGLSDPQVWTVNAVDKTMPRVSSGDGVAKFKLGDGTFQVDFRHNYGKRGRHNVKFTQNKIAADPFNTTRNEAVSMTVNLTVDVPIQGFTIAEQGYIVAALLAELAASSAALTTQLLGGEI
jgi:hypothetical protein